MRFHKSPLGRHGFRIDRPAHPALDFICAAMLIAVTSLHIIVLWNNVSLDSRTMLLIALSAIVNLTGLFVSIARQRAIFTVTFFFALFFFNLAPIQQLVLHFDPLMEDPAILLRAVCFCLIFSGICLAALLTMTLAPLENRAAPIFAAGSFPASACAVLFALLCVAACIGFVGFGKGLFSDRTIYSENLQADYAQPIYLLYGGALRPFIVYGSLVGLWLAWSFRRMAWVIAFAVTLFCGFILSNPLVTARFEVATFVCAGVFYWAGRRRCRFLVIVLLLGMVLSPIFNLFRAGGSSLEYGNFTSFLVGMDYDAFSLLCHTIWHVDYHGLDYGKNIVSAFLFFVPRAIWPDKNEVTPYYLIESLKAYRGLWNTNLSEPLVAEGYFAFGLAGIVSISLVYAWFARLLEQRGGENRLSAVYLFCCAAPPLLFVLLRGSLLVGVSLVVGHFVATFASVAIVKRPIRPSWASHRLFSSNRQVGHLQSRLSPPREDGVA